MKPEIDINTLSTEYLAGATALELAAKYGLSVFVVKHRLVRAGVRIGSRGPRKNAAREVLLQRGFSYSTSTHASTRCADAVLRLLHRGITEQSELEARLPYTPSTIRATLLALVRVGCVERVEKTIWEPTD